MIGGLLARSDSIRGMHEIAVAATVFGLVFVGELPDKTAIASLVLGLKYPARWVFAGVAAAFVTHVVIAVAAGSLIGLLPHRPLEALVALLFLIGAVLVWREGNEDEDEEIDAEEAALGAAPVASGFWKVAALGYAAIFVGEWGDLTQILTANLAAKYTDPLVVGIGAVLALWAVALLALLGGKALLRVIPMRLITRIAAVVMVALAIWSIVNAVRG